MHPAVPPTRNAGLFQKTTTDPQADEAGEIRRGLGADGIRAVIGCRLAGDDPHHPVDRQTHPHLVQRLARVDLASVVAGQVEWLGIDQPGFDVEQPILPAIAAQRKRACV
jgi:hypothetical protein